MEQMLNLRKFLGLSIIMGIAFLGCTSSLSPVSGAQAFSEVSSGPPALPATFVISELSFSQKEVRPDETVKVSVNLKNIGQLEGTFEIELYIDDGLEQKRLISLDGGENEILSFNTSRDEPGVYQVSIGDLKGTFTVIEPEADFDFEITGLSIKKRNLEPGESTKITVNVANLGGGDGSKLVNLRIDGNIFGSENVYLGPNESKILSFEVSRNAVGTYLVEVDGLSDNFKVQEPPSPAKFEFIDLLISNHEIEKGKNTEITVNVKNIGDLKGTKIVFLLVDGVKIRTKNVELGPSESEKLSFFVRGDEIGTREVSVGGLTGKFEVTEPLAPPKFEVSDLEVEKKIIESGETINVSVKVTNVGGETGTYIAELFLDGKSMKEELTLESEEIETVNFKLAIEDPGSYEAFVENLTETFEVIKTTTPPEFVVENLVVDKSVVESGEIFTASGWVTNTGGEKGSYIVELTFGDEAKTEDVILDPGQSEKISFEILMEDVGIYEIKMNGLTDEVKVESSDTGLPLIWIALAVGIVAALIWGTLVLRKRGDGPEIPL